MKLKALSILLFSIQLVTAVPESELVLGYEIDFSDPFGAKRLALPQEHILNPVEAEFVRKMAMLQGQRRTKLYLDPVLCMTARVKLDDGHFQPDHRDEEGKLMREWVDLSFGELLGASPENFATSHDGHREVILGLPGTEVFGEGQDFADTIYVGIAANGVHCVVHFSYIPYGDNYMGSKRRLFLPEGTEVKLTDNWMEKAFVGNREMLMNLGVNEDGTLQSNWLGRVIDVGGGFVKTADLGLVFIAQDSGWGSVAPNGTDYTSWASLFAATPINDFGAARTDYDKPLLPYLKGWEAELTTFNVLLQSPNGSNIQPNESRVLNGGVYYTYRGIDGEQWGVFGKTKIPFDYVYSGSPDTIWISGNWRFQNKESFKQGYRIFHPKFGWLWTHPEIYPTIWVVNQNRWVNVKELTPQQGYANLELSSWQGFVGDSVVLAWDTDKASNLVEIAGVKSTHKIGAWAVPLETAGEMVATMQAGDVQLEKKVIVLPKPVNPTVWIDAQPKVVAPNEKFLISWNATGGVPIVRGESQGIFSNEGAGSVLFARRIPGDYTFTVRLGDAQQTVTVRVTGDLIR